MTTWGGALLFEDHTSRHADPGGGATQESAEEIFGIVTGFLDWLPDELREGPLQTSRANVGRLCFPASIRNTDGSTPPLLAVLNGVVHQPAAGS